jgi:hypothetical protein
MAATAQRWRVSTIGTACTYPFGEQEYSETFSASITGTVLSDKDPYVSLQRITKGSNDFGVSLTQKHRVGVALVVVGIIFAIPVYGILAAVIYYFCVRAPDGPSNCPFDNASGSGPAPVKAEPRATPSYPPQPQPRRGQAGLPARNRQPVARLCCH